MQPGLMFSHSPSVQLGGDHRPKPPVLLDAALLPAGSVLTSSIGVSGSAMRQKSGDSQFSCHQLPACWKLVKSGSNSCLPTHFAVRWEFDRVGSVKRSTRRLIKG